MAPDEDTAPEDDLETDDDDTVKFAEVEDGIDVRERVLDIDPDDAVLVMVIDGDAELELLEPPVEVELELAVVLVGLQVTRWSVVSAMIADRIDCCWSYHDRGAKSSPTKVIVGTLLLRAVVEDPVMEAEQAVTVEHESVMVDVDAVVAPVGVKTEYNVLQALAVRTEQQLLLGEDDEDDEDMEDCEVELFVWLDLDDCSADDDLLSSSSSSPSVSSSWAISARLSVKFSNTPMSGGSSLTTVSILLRTLLAQLKSIPIS